MRTLRRLVPRAGAIAALALSVVLLPVLTAGPAHAAIIDGDLVVSPVSVSANPQVGQPFSITFTISNVGTADIGGTSVSLELAFGSEQGWQPARAPLGCSVRSSGPPFPQRIESCPTGPIKAGQSVTKQFWFTSPTAGTVSRFVAAYPSGGSDPTPNNNDVDYTVTIAPAPPGGGSGGGGLGGLQALVAALLALLHL
jgi:hypothetical protein